ncbi:MAG TPA: TolC family protein [Vicinamibacterales bacterium]|nr:TolC family protein [Vicinamibacterales bacterium]
MRATPHAVIASLSTVLLHSTPAWSQQQPPPSSPPLVLAQPEAPAAPPATITLQDALDRAKQNDLQFQSAFADAESAREDRVQARSTLLPAISFTTQYLGNSPNGVNPNGRFVSLDGVKMYRAWAVARQDLSANVLMRTPLLKARAVEAATQAKLEVAQRGLLVTVTRSYYALVVAQRRYATTQTAAQQAGRFFDQTQQQQRLGQVARSDVVKAEIQYQQQQQAFRDAQVAMENARLGLAVLLSPTFDENFTVVDDLVAAPVLPPFADVRTMAGRSNPDVRAADEALRAAGHDVQAAKNAFLPSIAVDAVYGIEANEFALHSEVAAQPEFGVLPNLGYFLTVNLSVPVWDWGSLRSKLHQSENRERLARVTLTQTQRQLMSNLYSMYNEAVGARSAVDNLQHVADLAAESLRLTALRYQAGESTALEVVDAQNTFVQARNTIDDAQVRYRVALAELQTLTGPF